MSVQCDKLANSMLNAQERKEEIDSLSSELYDINNQIKDLKSDYEEYQHDNQYDEMEDLLVEICSLNERQQTIKESLSEFNSSKRFY